MARKEHFVQEAFPGMLKGTALGIVSKSNRVLPTPPNLTNELRQGNRPMFMTGPEIMHNYDPNYWDKSPSESNDDLWARKLHESKRGSFHDTNYILRDGETSSLEESVRNSGVRKPIFLGEFSKTRNNSSKPEVKNGHHRVAVASSIDPNMLLPVDHTH